MYPVCSYDGDHKQKLLWDRNKIILTNLMNAKKLTWESESLVGVEAQEEHRNFPVLLMLPVEFVVLKHTKQDFSPC